MTRPTIPTNNATSDPRFHQQQWDRPADKVRAAANQQYDRIRARKAELRPEALLAGMAKVYATTKQQLDAMGSAAGPNQLAVMAKAKRALYGIDDLTAGMSPAEHAATQMSYRDAQARAAQVTSNVEAKQLLDTADQSGDELLARAIGNRALSEPGFADIADAYLTARPNKQTAQQQLNDAQPEFNMANMWEFVSPKPTELSHLNDAQIAQLAQSTGTP